ncbi:hypothetical protein BDR05DRAFT_44709 [Suillus weaverae]|nr:hypothetical protein BDR05DRAFT_44709 [Suillus weaverae]
MATAEQRKVSAVSRMSLTCQVILELKTQACRFAPPITFLALGVSDNDEATESDTAKLRICVNWNRDLDRGLGEGEGVDASDWDDCDDFGVKKTSSSSDSPTLRGLARLEDSAASEEVVIWDLSNFETLRCAAATSISSLLAFGGVHTSVSYPNLRSRGELKGVENLSITKSIMSGISPDVLGDSRSFGVRIGDGGQSVVASKRKSEDVRVRRTCVEDSILSANE